MHDDAAFVQTDADLAQAAMWREWDHARQVREESVTRWVEAVVNEDDGTEDGEE